jgi:hypothetical protein
MDKRTDRWMDAWMDRQIDRQIEPAAQGMKPKSLIAKHGINWTKFDEFFI